MIENDGELLKCPPDVVVNISYLFQNYFYHLVINKETEISLHEALYEHESLV